MEEFSIVPAQFSNIELLTQMNKELIEDENSNNTMTLSELKDRMTNFLREEWKALLFILKDQVVGYALYKEVKETSNAQGNVIYLRQYYISRAYRRRGLGKQAIHMLKTGLFKEAIISVDVLESNPSGRQFWEEVGFKTYYTNMQLQQ